MSRHIGCWDKGSRDLEMKRGIWSIHGALLAGVESCPVANRLEKNWGDPLAAQGLTATAWFGRYGDAVRALADSRVLP